MQTPESPRLKVLICIPWFSPAFRAGGPIRSIENLVSRKSNREYFIFCGHEDVSGQPLDVETGKWLLYNEFTKVYYADKNNRSDKLVNASNTIKPDVIFINGIYSWHFTIVPLYFCKAPKKIISVRGMLHKGALGQKMLKKQAYLFLWKLMSAQHKAFFHATSTEEVEMINSFFDDDVKVLLAKNYPAKIDPLPQAGKEPGALKIVSVALISPMKNHLLVLQSLLNCTHKIEYHIIGSVKDENYWNRCKEVIVRLPVNVTVRYDGELPHSQVLNVLKDAHVFVLASESENFGHAIAEALSAGRPVITSKYTPWNDLELSKAGFNVELNTVDISKVIDKFAEMGDGELGEWSRGAAEYFSREIKLEEIDKQYENLFEINGGEFKV